MNIKKGKVLLLIDPASDRQDEATIISWAIKYLGGTCLKLGYEDLLFKNDFITVDYDRKKKKATVILNKKGKRFILNDEIVSVLNLFTSFPRSKFLKDFKEDELKFFYNEWHYFMQGIYLLLKDRLWLNPYPDYFVHQEKCHQLQAAQQIGFKIPETLISTSLKDAYRRLKSVKDPLVYKAFSQQFFEKEKKGKKKEMYGLYTNLIDAKQLVDQTPKYPTPNIFQVYVPKKVELRLTIVGDAIFATEIHSQKSKVSAIDWRHYDLKNTPYLKHRLPADIKKKCLKMMREFNLSYAAIDMIVTPKGEYVFLELNPLGRWGWIEELTKHPITENIARMLLAGSVHYKAREVHV